MSEENFDELFEKAYAENSPDYNKHINIAVVGKVSSGKSSLLNAIIGCERSDPIARVGALSGETTQVTPYHLDEHVLIIDSPGLDDIRKENSVETESFLKEIDLGLFVVTGSADASQKSNYDDLKEHSEKVIIILNKIDEWDDLEESAYDLVIEQWKSVLNADKVFGVCTKGYDPKMRKNAPMDIRGIDKVKTEIFNFLEEEGKDILFARHLRDKNKYAIKLIAGTLVIVAGEAFIPGSAAYITATQALSIASLYYLYTGTTLSKAPAVGLVATFAGESVGMNLFLWAKSFLPPTGVVDIVAAGVAMLVTFAMLASVKWVLENGDSLEKNTELKKAFERFKVVGKEFKNVSFSDIKDKESMYQLVMKLLSGTKAS